MPKLLRPSLFLLRFLVLFLALIVPTAFADTGADSQSSKVLVYFGTYTRGDSEGIYVYQLDLESGKLKHLHTTGNIENPSFLAIHPSGKYLYSVNEVAKFNGKPGGGVTAFKIKDDGSLAKLNEQSTVGGGPCHLVVDHEGTTVLAANYGGGSVVSFPIADDGSLQKHSSFFQHKGSSVTPRQTAPHGHSINVDPKNTFAYAADLGLDKILIYKLNTQKRKLIATFPSNASVAPGAGPRHFSFHPSGNFAYVINELNMTVTAFKANPFLGGLKEIQTISTLPPGEKQQKGQSTADVQVSPSGRFLYGSNRGHDTIVVYSIDQKTGKLTYVENESTQGKTPRNFGIDPTESYLLAENQNSGTVAVLKIDKETGALSPTGIKVDVPSPVCAKFLMK